MKKITKWGIIGSGKIAHHFASDLKKVASAETVGVASRSLGKAKHFADQYQIPQSFGSYEALFDSPDIDIVYIATPHHAHEQWSISAMQAGKHVLCEKPLGVNAQQVKRMQQVANENNVFLMEALWTRFNPSFQAVLAGIEQGLIGTPNFLHADFAFVQKSNPADRLLNPDLAGGALLDIGIYPVFLAYMLLGKPQNISAVANFHATGVDEQVAMLFHYKKAVATLSGSFASDIKMEAKIGGTKGYYLLHDRWHEANSYALKTGNELTKMTLPRKGMGYIHEIEAVQNALRNHEKECSKWTWQNSLELAELLDEVRRLIGLQYPFE